MVGYDGSDSAMRALDVAADLAGYGSTLAVVTVHTTEFDHSVTDDDRDQLQRRLVEAGYHETSGEPAKQLIKKAHELRADLLVIGRRNGSPLLGSVSSKVVRRANCDVLVVR
jgi:nucleotide-binding universal stress UspA family protein